MRGYIAFIRKEWLESVRTYKLFLLLAVFVLFGYMNPLLAKFMPQLVATFMPAGMQISLPEPTALDAWAQFFKNVGQMGMIVLLIIFSGLMANEFVRGTLVNILTKGLPRATVILAKFTAATMIWSISYALCFAVTYTYTAYFWDEPTTAHLTLAIVGGWLFGVLLIALLIGGGVMFRTITGSLLCTGGTIVVLMIANFSEAVQPYNPITLVARNMELLTSSMPVADFVTATFVCVGAIVVTMSGATYVFNRGAM